MRPTLDLLDLINFGMCLVIWLVQTVIYPGFGYYPADRLIRWHARYSGIIPVFVVPLMLAQLGLLVVAAYGQGGPAVNGMLVMVLLCWGATFRFSVPLHRRITADDDPSGAAAMLVRTNWPRTVLWSAVFLVGLFFS